MVLKAKRRLLLEGPEPVGLIRQLSDRIDPRTFAEGNRTTVVNLARVTTFRDPWYGKVELTRKKFQQMIKNFEANTYGQEIFIDIAHQPSDGAAARMTRLSSCVKTAPMTRSAESAVARSCLPF